MENGKSNFGLKWQILKPFAGTFHRAQTLKLGGVMVYVYSNEIKKNQIQI